MRAPARYLVNTPEIELWPGGLLRARSNDDARTLARAQCVLRRKRDGRYLAAVLPEGIQPLLPRWSREPGVEAALDALDALPPVQPHPPGPPPSLPLTRIGERLDALGLDRYYGDATGLALVAEPARLTLAGQDRFGRALWLSSAAARAWQRMRLAAASEGVAMDAISGYRSHDYQLGIFERKLARGIALAQILEVNAAPGYSEHHDGNAIDIGAPGGAPAEETFEATPAYAWLRDNGADWGFRLSYPRDNAHGIAYEPWHWYHTGSA